MAKYMILQGDGRTVQGQLDKFATEGYAPILYSAVHLPGGQQGHPGIINHCMVIELKEEKK
jgi:hypothetical protein